MCYMCYMCAGAYDYVLLIVALAQCLSTVQASLTPRAAMLLLLLLLCLLLLLLLLLLQLTVHPGQSAPPS
jgi:Trk-type K+ transport system membrane component